MVTFHCKIQWKSWYKVSNNAEIGMYVCMYVCMDGWPIDMDVWMYGWMDVWMYGVKFRHFVTPPKRASRWPETVRFKPIWAPSCGGVHQRLPGAPWGSPGAPPRPKHTYIQTYKTPKHFTIQTFRHKTDPQSRYVKPDLLDKTHGNNTYKKIQT